VILSILESAFWEDTIIPLLNQIIDNLNFWLVPDFGKDLKLTFNKDEINVLAQKREKLWQYVENASFITKNEKRQMFGFSPIEDNLVD